MPIVETIYVWVNSLAVIKVHGTPVGYITRYGIMLEHKNIRGNCSRIDDNKKAPKYAYGNSY